MMDLLIAILGGDRQLRKPRYRGPSDVQRCYFGEAASLPLAPEPEPTKRQRRRIRGKRKAGR